MKQTLLLVLSLFVFNFSTAQNSVDASDLAADSWSGYMNVFSSDGGYLWGSPWGVPALAVADDDTAGTLTLSPNVNGCDDAQSGGTADDIAYWAEGNLILEANVYNESNTMYNGADLTFSGYVSSNTLTDEHTGYYFIKALDPNNGWGDVFGGSKIMALPESGAFEVSATADELTTGLYVQMGFQLIGDNTCSDSTTDYGSIVITAAPVVATPPNVFFSEYAEGSSDNKYLEIYNASDETVDLTQFGYPSVGNAPSNPGTHEYWNDFDEGASVAPGEVYVIAHPGFAGDYVADETHQYLSNGDDGYALVYGTEEDFVIVDVIGQSIYDADYDDPGQGWDVAGESQGTKDHVMVRKSSVTSGNGGDWAASAGTSAEDSEWILYDYEVTAANCDDEEGSCESDNWSNLGSHQFGEPEPADCSFDVFMSAEGDYPGEITWDITNAAGEVVMSGTGSSTDVQVLEASFGDVFTLNMADSWGDGWNGGSLSIGGEEYTIANGAEGTATITCSDPNSVGIATITAAVSGPYSGTATFDFTTINFTVGSDETADGHIHWSINDGAFDGMLYESSMTLNGLPDGTHVMTAFLADAAHNAIEGATTAEVEFTITTLGCDSSTVIDYPTGFEGVYATALNAGGTVSVIISGTVEEDYDFISVTDGAGNVLVEPTSGALDIAVESADGVINVILDSDGTVTDTFTITTICGGLSTEDNNILDMTVYPNPVEDGLVSILTPINGEKFVELYTVTGRKVLETTINGNTLDVSSLTSGFYMLKVTVEGQSNITKLVVR